MSQELDFSEEACMERYVMFPYFEEDCERGIYVNGLPYDDPIVCALNSHGCIYTDWDISETIIASHDNGDMTNDYKHLKMAA